MRNNACLPIAALSDGTESPRSMRYESKRHLTKEITDFCKKKGIFEYLKVAIDIIRESFTSVRQWSLLPEQDPETGEKWLLIDIAVDGTADEILEAYDRYIDQWVSATPESAREGIKLSYRIF
jgi:hypothetical protein